MSCNKIIFFFIITVYTLMSCKEESKIEKDAKFLIGREIVFPSEGKVFSCGTNISMDSLMHANIRIVTYFDDLQCTSCGIKMLKIWEKEIHDMDKDIAYIVIVHPQEKEKFQSILDSLHLCQPIILDSKGEFMNINELNETMFFNRTFLLDPNNKVVIIGEPFKSDKLKSLYKKQINKMKVYNSTN